MPSSKGFRYFLIFVDDFSRMTWLYLLKEISEVSGVIELFHNEIKTQSSTFICVFRADNALEYIKMMCLFFALRMRLFIKPPALIRPNRIVLRTQTQTHLRCCSNHDDSYACSEVFVG